MVNDAKSFLNSYLCLEQKRNTKNEWKKVILLFFEASIRVKALKNEMGYLFDALKLRSSQM